MRSDLLQDAIGMVRDEYIEDAHADSAVERAKRHAEKPAEGSVPRFSLGKMAAGLCAAVLLVFGLYRIGLVPFTGNGGGQFETAEEMENTTQAGGDLAGVGDMTGGETNVQWETGSCWLPESGSSVVENETDTHQGLPEIIWSAVLGEASPENVFQESTAGSLDGLGSSDKVIETRFQAVLDKAADNEIFAFVVRYGAYYSADSAVKEQIEVLHSAYRQARNTRDDLRNDLYWELKDGGMSSAEAFARIYKNPEFVESRQAALDALREWKLAELAVVFEDQKEKLEEIQDMGITLLYDASDEEYCPYLAAVDGLGVMYGTKAQILELGEMVKGCRIRAAAEHAENYEFIDQYTGHEIYLSEGNYLTDPLIAAYEQADGQKLRVEVQMAYYGETLVKDEKHKAVLAYMGVSQAEYEARCGEIEFRQQYIAAEKYVTSNRDYYEEVIRRLLKEDELAEEWDGGSSVLANLTYERALELAANEEIAYIELAD